MRKLQYSAFVKVISRQPAGSIRGLTKTYADQAKRSPDDSDADRILTFQGFLEEQIVPNGLSEEDLAFYKLVAKKLVKSRGMLPDVLEDFS